MVMYFTSDAIESAAQVSQKINSTQQISSIESAQDIIYNFLIEIVKQWQPEIVIQEFKHLFIQDNDSISSTPVRAIYEIVFANKIEEFHYTIKRACYILINNWIARRRYKYVQKLVKVFKDPIVQRKSLSPMIDRLRSWIRAFINTKDYQDLELYAQVKITEQSRLSQRYTSYLLATQNSNIRNPFEHKEAAINRTQQLECRFKFDLAMYMARFESVSNNQQLKAPTAVGDEVLRIIKIVTAKSDVSSYTNLADTFLKQVRGQSYKEFKQRLQNYLTCYGESQQFISTFSSSLTKKLDSLYEEYDEKRLTDKMLLKTCKKLIDHLTTDNRRKPSHLLASLMSEGHPLTVIVILLKIVLICRPARTHLESCIADLIWYHESSDECSWMINFIEIYNVMFAIYADKMSLQAG